MSEIQINNGQNSMGENKVRHIPDVVSSDQADKDVYVQVKTAQGITKVKIIEFIQLDYIDNRKLEIAELADDTFVIGIVNPKLSDRADRQHMRLTRDSFYGLFSALLMFVNADPLALNISTKKQKIISFIASDKILKANDDKAMQEAQI